MVYQSQRPYHQVQSNKLDLDQEVWCPALKFLMYHSCGTRNCTLKVSDRDHCLKDNLRCTKITSKNEGRLEDNSDIGAKFLKLRLR